MDRQHNQGMGYTNQAGRQNHADQPTQPRFQKRESNGFVDIFTKVLNLFGAIFCPIKKDKK
jgi:hypothetical protein